MAVMLKSPDLFGDRKQMNYYKRSYLRINGYKIAKFTQAFGLQ